MPSRGRAVWKALAAGAIVVATPLSACARGSGAGTETVLVVGDSISSELAGGLQRVAGGRFTTINGGVDGCGIGAGEIETFGDGNWYASSCPNWAADWRKLVKRHDPDVVVVHTGFWESFDRRVDGQVLSFGSAEADAALRAAYERAVRILGSQGASVVWLTVPCFAPAPYNGKPLKFTDARVEHLNALYAEFTATSSETTLIDYRPAVCPDDEYAQVVDGVTVRPDDGIHYTQAGADLAAEYVLGELVELGV